MEKYKLYNIDLYENFNKYLVFFNQISSDMYDIKETLPLYKLDEFEKLIAEKENKLLFLDEESKYLKMFDNYDNLFNKLVPATIDILAYKAFVELESNESILSNIKSFKPKNKKAKKVIYDKTNNVTGRLVVKQGPKILTLPSRYRSILRSKHDKGSIYSIDFSSLEPRITAKLSNNDTDEDIYTNISERLSFNADRSVIKKAVISSIYGAKYTSLEGLSLERSKEIFEKINEYFDFKKILELSCNIDSLGIRRNYFGRPLWNINEERENVLINNYIQSTAVDISLKYFEELVTKCDLFDPLFVLHDALIVDIEDANYKNVHQIINHGYNDSNLGYFPLKLEKFNI